MSMPVDLVLKKAFGDLQIKMVGTSKKIQVIDSKINLFNRILLHIDVTKNEMNTLPSGTKTYESLGRTFLLTDLEKVKTNLKNRESQLHERITELENKKQYLEKNLKESEDNIREMVQMRKELHSEPKSN